MIIHLSPTLENGLIYLIFNSNLFISLIYLAYSFCIGQTDGWSQSVCSVAQSCPTLCEPHGLWHTRLFCPWDFPGKSPGVGCQFLLQRILLTPGLYLHLLCLLHQQADCGSQVVGEMAIYLPETGTVFFKGVVSLGEAGRFPVGVPPITYLLSCSSAQSRDCIIANGMRVE